MIRIRRSSTTPCHASHHLVGYRRGFLSVTLLLGLFLPAAGWSAEPALTERLADSLALVRSYRGQQLVASGTGVIVKTDRGSGYLLVAAGLVTDQETLTVRAPGSSAELVAQVVLSEPALNVAVLNVQGLQGPGLLISDERIMAGDSIWAAVKRDNNTTVGVARGNVSNRSTYLGASVDTGLSRTQEDSIQLIGHDAQVSDAGIGAVLVNDCGHMVGFDGGSAGALDISTLRTLLGQQNLNLAATPVQCLSALGSIQERAEQAAREAQQARTVARNAEASASAFEQQLASTDKVTDAIRARAREVRARADEAMLAAQTAADEAAAVHLELENKTTEIAEETRAMVALLEAGYQQTEAELRESLRQQEASQAYQDQVQMLTFVILGIACLGLFTVGGILLLNSRRAKENARVVVDRRAGDRRKRAADAAASGSAAAPQLGAADARYEAGVDEFVLDGRDDVGLRYLLRLSGDRLRQEAGVVVGRNPKDSPYILNHADVSRRHARLKLMKDHMFIEDLGSTNGTVVNGQSIDSKGMVSIGNGDQVVMGSVVMKLRTHAA